MRRRGRATIAAALGSLLLAAASTPVAHASGGPGGGNADRCTPVVGGQVGVTTPVPVAEKAAVDCPFASGPTGVPTGPSGPQPGPFQPGQSCWYVTYQPVKFQVGAGGSVTEFDPNANGSLGPGLGYPKDLAPVPIVEQENYDIYMPYRFSGKADANGNCTVNIKSQLGCPDPVAFTNFVVAGNICWKTFPHQANGGGINPGQLTPFLDTANLLQFINIGTLSSLPANPNPSLVNIGTCFFLNGAAFTALGGGPQPITTPAFYRMSVSQPLNDGTGRFIFYVFRIELAFTGMTWDFGDNSSATDSSLPGPCASVPAEIAVSHTYSGYGTFQVSITEHYDVTVDEFWEDAGGEHETQLTGIVPPITRVLGPFQKTVVQEEGVPVGAP
ncbi:MAG TPA: hypothetical protein VE953_03055 [Terriglobales bacterium]|nr:hypothetical protein [Terriglobales bacterium]